MARRDDWDDVKRFAENLDRRYPGLRAVLCTVCNEPGGKAFGTLTRHGKTNEGKQQYAHRRCVQ